MAMSAVSLPVPKRVASDADVRALAGQWLGTVSLETMLVHPLLFGLTTASPLQRAICRVASGSDLAELAEDPTVIASLGGTTRLHGRPEEVAIVAGIRTYKSGLAACMGSHAALQCDASGLRPGEQLRVSIVSTKLENAKAVYQHLSGAWTKSPVLRRFLVTDPQNASDRFTIERPDGVRVEFLTVAGSRAGSALVSFWQAAVIFDEYARMTGDAAEGVINWHEQRAAVVHRVRERGYLVHISSPYAPFGPAYEHVSTHLGRPSRHLVVFHARADHMNPTYWTKARCAEAEKKDPEAYLTDVLAGFASPETQLFHSDHIDACTRKSDALPSDARATYGAWMDPATRGNRWTFGVFTRDGRKRQMVLGREWMGSRAQPLDPGKVFCSCEDPKGPAPEEHAVDCTGIAAVCKRYGVTAINADGWSGDALAHVASRHGLILSAKSPSTDEDTQRYLDVRTMLAQSELDLPVHVEAVDHATGEIRLVRQHRTDLLRVKKAPSATGPRIVLPKTSDGSHCDWAPTIAGGFSYYVDDLRPFEPTPEAKLEADALEASLRMFLRERGEDEDE